MTTEQLQTFLSLVETKNFSASAKNLIVSQSTISKRIFELEKEINQALFTRGRRGASLTHAGKVFLEYAEQIMAMEEKAIGRINRSSKFLDYLTFSSVYAYYDIYLKDQLKTFICQNPNISVRINLAHSGQILSDMRRARTDIAFSHLPYKHPDYVNHLIEEDDVILVSDYNNRTFCNGISYKEIKNIPFVSSNFLYATTHNWLFPPGHQFQLEIEVSAYAADFIRNSYWHTLLARKMVQERLDEHILREIPLIDGEIPKVQYYMIYRREYVNQAAVQKWLSRILHA